MLVILGYGLAFLGLVILAVALFIWKQGDADFVFDVRHLPNPHWDLELRKFSGLDEPVRIFLQSSDQANEMYQDIYSFLNKWLPAFSKGHRHYITVSIGCTGGQHRSVYIVDRLQKALQAEWSVQVLHREMKHWS